MLGLEEPFDQKALLRCRCWARLSQVSMKLAAEHLAGVARGAGGPAVEYDPPGTRSPVLDLLACLRTVADRHKVAIANVAVRWVLDRPQVGGVIIGARLGIAGGGLSAFLSPRDSVIP